MLNDLLLCTITIKNASLWSYDEALAVKILPPRCCSPPAPRPPVCSPRYISGIDSGNSPTQQPHVRHDGKLRKLPSLAPSLTQPSAHCPALGNSLPTLQLNQIRNEKQTILPSALPTLGLNAHFLFPWNSTFTFQRAFSHERLLPCSIWSYQNASLWSRQADFERWFPPLHHLGMS